MLFYRCNCVSIPYKSGCRQHNHASKSLRSRDRTKLYLRLRSLWYSLNLSKVLDALQDDVLQADLEEYDSDPLSDRVGRGSNPPPPKCSTQTSSFWTFKFTLLFLRRYTSCSLKVSLIIPKIPSPDSLRKTSLSLLVYSNFTNPT